MCTQRCVVYLHSWVSTQRCVVYLHSWVSTQRGFVYLHQWVSKQRGVVYPRKHEWDKHGTCATCLPALKDEVHYFNVTLGLHDRFNLAQ